MKNWLMIFGMIVVLLTCSFAACCPEYDCPERTELLVDFPSLAALQEFLCNDQTDKNRYVPVVYDCEDFSLDLILAAERLGYRLHIQYIQLDLENAHALCSAIIGNEVYFIEPQTDQVWHIGSLD